MARFKSSYIKKVLAKKNRQTKWAPIWAVWKALGHRKGHPYKITVVKRHWRRSKIKV